MRCLLLIALAASFILAPGFVNSTAAQRRQQQQAEEQPVAVDLYKAETQLVLAFAKEFNAGTSADQKRLRQLEAEVVARNLLTAGDLVQIKAKQKAPGMSMFALIGLNGPTEPYFVPLQTDRGPVTMLVYRKFFGLFMYLDYYFVHGGKLVGWREADMTQPVRKSDNQPTYSVVGANLDTWCVSQTLTQIRCVNVGGGRQVRQRRQ